MKGGKNMPTQFIIQRIFENDKIIIYKRMFSLQNCCGSQRYYEYFKRPFDKYGRQFRSITQVNKYIKELQTT